MYLDASLCIYIFLAHDRRYILRYVVYVYVFCFTMLLCLLIYIYDVIHDICLYFVLCEIKKFFSIFLVFFHTCVYVFVKCYRNIQVDSSYAAVYFATVR